MKPQTRGCVIHETPDLADRSHPVFHGAAQCMRLPDQDVLVHHGLQFQQGLRNAMHSFKELKVSGGWCFVWGYELDDDDLNAGFRVNSYSQHLQSPAWSPGHSAS